MTEAANTQALEPSSRPRPSRQRNIAVVAGLIAIIAAMGTLVYYSVPLYRLFCQVTGFGGTTQTAAVAKATSCPATFADSPMRMISVSTTCRPSCLPVTAAL